MAGILIVDLTVLARRRARGERQN